MVYDVKAFVVATVRYLANVITWMGIVLAVKQASKVLSVMKVRSYPRLGILTYA